MSSKVLKLQLQQATDTIKALNEKILELSRALGKMEVENKRYEEAAANSALKTENAYIGRLALSDAEISRLKAEITRLNFDIDHIRKKQEKENILRDYEAKTKRQRDESELERKKVEDATTLMHAYENDKRVVDGFKRNTNQVTEHLADVVSRSTDEVASKLRRNESN
jgi:hypothetical protein